MTVPQNEAKCGGYTGATAGGALGRKHTAFGQRGIDPYGSPTATALLAVVELIPALASRWRRAQRHGGRHDDRAAHDTKPVLHGAYESRGQGRSEPCACMDFAQPLAPRFFMCMAFFAGLAGSGF